jgi:dUTP pyrophosphatase
MTDNSIISYYVDKLLNVYGKCMYLKIFVDSDDKELKEKYIEAINERRYKMIDNSGEYIDAGFDLFAPDMKRFTSLNVNKLDYKIKCSATIREKNNIEYNTDIEYNTGFYMYPRSSISKSNIRLANNVGIIDAGYRGNLIGMFDLIYTNEMDIDKFDRYLQICAPGIIPIMVELVNSIEELGNETARGSGGFGSTGL